MQRLRVTLACAVLALAACEPKKSNLDAPAEFFGREKIGTSPDYAVIKWKDPQDHVITVHGFVDDHEACEKVVKALNVDACAETDGQNCLNPFSCRILNP